jgi:hypothetical protein
MTENSKRCEALYLLLTDNGLLIEAGWASFRASVISSDAPEVRLREMRLSFFAGAQHLFGSIMTILDPGAESTEADLNRMELINNELDKFVTEMKAEMDGRAI